MFIIIYIVYILCIVYFMKLLNVVFVENDIDSYLG